MTTKTRLAGQLAGQRADECRERRAQLAAGVRHVPADVSRAREFLVRAQARATSAQVSAISRETRFGHGQHSAPLVDLPIDGDPYHQLDQVPDGDASLERAAELGVSDAQWYDAYWALGGTCSPFEVEAFLRVGATLPHLERLRLAQALWEFAL